MVIPTETPHPESPHALILQQELPLVEEIAARRRIALLRALGMLNSALWAIGGWVILRFPETGLICVMGPVLATCGATTEPTRQRRVRAVWCNISVMALIQFVRANLDQQSFLVLAAIFLMAMWVHLWQKNAMSASAIMAGGLLNIGYTPYLMTAEIVFDLTIVGIGAAWSFALLDRCLLREEPDLRFPATPQLHVGSAYRRAFVFTAAYYLTQLTGYQEAFWVVLTVALCYLNGDVGSKVRHVAYLRYVWAPFGLWGALLVLSTVSYADYRFNYLAPGIGFLAFYLLYRTGKYVLFYLLFMVMIGMGLNLTSAGNAFGNSYNFLLQSTAMIAAGALLAALAEWRHEVAN